jgi:hypothetical protein
MSYTANTTDTPLETAEKFLAAIFGNGSTGHINIWTMPDKKSRFFELPAGIHAAAEYAVGKTGTHNVYFGCCPQNKDHGSRRGRHGCLPPDGLG